MKQLPPRRPQRGIVLIVALVMLVLITLVSLATIRSTTMDERMAGNARDRDRAFQAAEAAVQACLSQIQSGSAFTFPVLDPIVSGTQNWDIDANWTDPSVKNTKSYAVPLANAGVAEDPRCMVEKLNATGGYRVTGRAVGGSVDSIVMLQATYSDE
jgi:type IV pilus assembly protein PilX